jgi:hypothetical protein
MSIKTNIQETFANLIQPEFASNVGLVAMVAAVTLGVSPSHEDKRAVLNQQAAVIKATNNEENSQRREQREDRAPEMISYSTFQRTPGRSGKY